MNKVSVSEIYSLNLNYLFLFTSSLNYMFIIISNCVNKVCLNVSVKYRQI